MGRKYTLAEFQWLPVEQFKLITKTIIIQNIQLLFYKKKKIVYKVTIKLYKFNCVKSRKMRQKTLEKYEKIQILKDDITRNILNKIKSIS